MADKPSYIGLLNAIANGERGGAKIFRNWAEVTTCEDIRGTLQTVAIREAEHAMAFEKRLCELGFGLRKKENPDLKKTFKIEKSDGNRRREIRTPRLRQEIQRRRRSMD